MTIFRRLLLLLALPALFAAAGCASTRSETAPPYTVYLCTPEASEAVYAVYRWNPAEAGKDYASYAWAPAEIVVELTDGDSWEGFNRAMFAVNRFGIFYVVRPIGWFWGAVFPKPVMECIDNFSENLCFPGRAVSCMLQNRWEDAGVESLRFLSNTTIGIAGLFDVADTWFELYPRGETFGQVFETWGVGMGPTLVLPLCAATNVRDHVGSVFDVLFDLKTYIPFTYGLSAGTRVNRAVRDFRPVYRLFKANADPYEIFKEFSAVQRRLDQDDWVLIMRLADKERRLAAKAEAEAVKVAANARSAEAVLPPAPEVAAAAAAEPDFRPPAWLSGKLVVLPEFRSEDPFADTVRVMKFEPQHDDSKTWTSLSPWNRDFTSLAKEPAVAALRPGMDPVEYYFWLPKDAAKKTAAPLVFVLPGIGSHHTSRTAVALAEVLHDAGYAVAILPSTFCWNFYQSMHPAPFPGYSPVDAKALRELMIQVCGQLGAEYDFTPSSTSVVGYSMGALHALFLADLEAKEDFLRIDRYVALNPPVDLVHALSEIDACARIARGWDLAKVKRVFPDGFAKIMLAGGTVAPFFHDDAPSDFDYRTHLSPEQSKLLVALAFRYTLRDVLMIAARDRRWETRSAYEKNGRTQFYLEADRVSFEEYMEQYVIPACADYLGEPLDRRELGRRAGLRGIENTLRTNRKIAVLHTLDDILVSDADRRYLDQTLGSRLTWFSHGAHLGHLYYTSVHQEILRHLPPAGNAP